MEASDPTSQINPPSQAPPTEESCIEPPTIHEDQVQMAVKFLSHPKVIGSSTVHCRSFLEQKGLSKQEIDEAFRQVPDLASNGFADETVSSEERQIISHGMQQNQVVSPHGIAFLPAQPVARQSMGTISLPLLQARVQPNWSYFILAIGFLTASTAGAAVFCKNILTRKFKAWILKVLKEEESLEQAKPSNSNSIEAVRAELVYTMQEMLKSQNEGQQELRSFIKKFESEMQELKSSLKQVLTSLNADRTKQESVEENA